MPHEAEPLCKKPACVAARAQRDTAVSKVAELQQMRRDLLALATQLVVDDGGEELGLAGRSFQVAFMEILDGVEEADEEEAHEEEAHEEAAHEDAARQSAYEAPLRSTDSFRDVFAQAAQHPSRPKAPAQTTSLAGQVAADIATSLLVEPPVIRSGQLKRSSGE